LEPVFGDLLHRLLYTDMKTYLVELLMKQDQMSMAASVKAAFPFSTITWSSLRRAFHRNMRLGGWPAK